MFSASSSGSANLTIRVMIRSLKMLKKLYLVFGFGVLLLYAAGSWFGVELANSGSHSRLGVPFIYTGFRGGK